jgi:hypothetical protein
VEASSAAQVDSDVGGVSTLHVLRALNVLFKMNSGVIHHVRVLPGFRASYKLAQEIYFKSLTQGVC